ncbi:MAG: alpha-ketoacid dehydrogenase subunit beta [Rhodospirillaceae bacterium]|nr:alpha-ketoacid dehydrogenase subunit beta [Rhodospirillaceae bacterium]
MTKKTYRAAINEAMAGEMRRDSSVIVMGEDVSGGTGSPGEDDAWGGPLGVTKGLHTEFGPTRVLDTPISEGGFMGAAAGAAITGLRPIVDLMFVDFLGVCLDGIFNQAAKFRYMFGGKAETPLVVRTMYGAGLRAASQHSQTLYSIFTHVPGVKVVVPSNPYDAKGLMIQAIRDNDPVVFFEHKAMYDDEGEVPDGAYTIPFGEANVLSEGEDVTIVAIGKMVHLASAAADNLAKDGISCTVIDPRTLSPLDEETILEEVEATGRLVVVDESHPRCSLAADISSIVGEKAFKSLKAGVQKVTAPHCPVPFASELEDLYMPTVEDVEAAVRRTMA